MKLQRVDKKSDQNYPCFDDYWKNRLTYMSTIAAGAGIALGTGMLTSCERYVRLRGIAPAVHAPASSQPEIEHPVPPAKRPVSFKGDVLYPAPPAKREHKPSETK